MASAAPPSALAHNLVREAGFGACQVPTLEETHMRTLFAFALIAGVSTAAFDATPAGAGAALPDGKAMPLGQFQKSLHLCEGLPRTLRRHCTPCHREAASAAVAIQKQAHSLLSSGLLRFARDDGKRLNPTPAALIAARGRICSRCGQALPPRAFRRAPAILSDSASSMSRLECFS